MDRLEPLISKKLNKLLKIELFKSIKLSKNKQDIKDQKAGFIFFA